MKNSQLQAVIERSLKVLGRIERGLTTAAFAVLILVVFSDVVSRELSGAGLHWARQAGVWANVVVVMFGLGVASAGGAHLRPRFADGWLPARFAPQLERLQDAGMAIFCLVFAAIVLDVVVESFALSERSVVLRIVIWPIQAAIPVAFTFAGLQMSVR